MMDTPQDELYRIEALRRLQILDTESSPKLERLVQMAAQIAATPIALVSLVDTDRQWFKARVGLDATQTPRCISFCAHAIKSDAPMEIRDTRFDQRFAQNPLVTGEPHIRYYLGIPLVLASGFRIGTLCVIDRAPRELAQQQIDSLRLLASIIMDVIEDEARLKALHQYTGNARDDIHNRPMLLASFEQQLRGPLEHVLGFSQMIEHDRLELPEESRVRRYGQLARASAQQLVRVVDAITRIEKAALGFDAKIERMDLMPTLAQVVKDAQMLVAGRGQSLSVNHDGLPVPVLADGSAVREILLHLLSNASRYSPATSMIRIDVHKCGATGLCSIDVGDEGPGISPSLVRQMQAPLFQPSALGSPMTGTLGLGLRLSKHLALSMNAQLALSSRKPRGTSAMLKLHMPGAV